jgi:hypothetical protein
VHSIFEVYSGEFVGCGTFLAVSEPERDVEYSVPDHLVEDCKSALRRAGYRLQSHTVIGSSAPQRD